MSPGASQQNNKSKNSKSKNVGFGDEEEKVVKRRVDEGDDFDVVESDPDELTSSDDEEGKSTKKGIKAKKEAERVKRRLEEISQVCK